MLFHHDNNFSNIAVGEGRAQPCQPGHNPRSLLACPCGAASPLLLPDPGCRLALTSHPTVCGAPFPSESQQMKNNIQGLHFPQCAQHKHAERALRNQAMKVRSQYSVQRERKMGWALSPGSQFGQTGLFPLSGTMISVEMFCTTLHLRDVNLP